MDYETDVWKPLVQESGDGFVDGSTVVGRKHGHHSMLKAHVMHEVICETHTNPRLTCCRQTMPRLYAAHQNVVVEVVQSGGR
jgi:hypothetical protein